MMSVYTKHQIERNIPVPFNVIQTSVNSYSMCICLFMYSK